MLVPRRIAVQCHKCGRSYEINKKYATSKYHGDFTQIICTNCVKSNVDVRKKISNAIQEKLKDETYRNKQKQGLILKHKDPIYHDRISVHLRKINVDPNLIETRRQTYQQTLATTDLPLVISNRSKALWQDPKFRQSVLDGMMQDDVRQKMAEGRDKQLRSSKLEDIVSRILDDLGVTYVPNQTIGYYKWDFVIEHKPRKLLIEVNGDYWHRQVAHVIKNDKSKRTFFERYLSTEYDMYYLWEHEFLCHNKVVDKIKQWLGVVQNIDFDFAYVTYNQITIEQSEIFLRAYHYLGSKNGYILGAFLGSKLIGVVVFSNPVRFESVTNLNLKYVQVLELSRFCIAPQYSKKNFASWLLSRATKHLLSVKPDIQAIIAFSDKTFNHNGTIYLASNWKHCGVIPPDYWYADNQGYYMHKRTLYGHAIRMKMKENDFAKKFGYIKVFGYEKNKFILHRQQNKIQEIINTTNIDK